MPEGPEIWILSKAINKYYFTTKSCQTNSFGKHLFVFDKFDSTCGENWSFGLYGKVFITFDYNELKKLNDYKGWKNGNAVFFENYQETINNLGTDWMTSEKIIIQSIVDKWVNSKKKLAALMLEQSNISGIGIAWGSEILFKAGLRPELRACDQDLNKLVDAIISIREDISQKYEFFLEKNNKTLKEFINNWFSNLYEMREMKIYKKGTQLKVLGRIWWV
jgi:formamidopyrimidine-DNA glycosylase